MAETILGTDGMNDVSISLWDRREGCFAIGRTGVGKSVLFENMIAQDLSQGVGLCVLDPTGGLIEKVINRIPNDRLDDVILLDPLDFEYPFPLNLFDCTNPLDPADAGQTVETVMGVFSKVFGASVETPRLNQYLRNIARTLINSSYTMNEIPHLLLDQSFRSRVTANTTGNAKLFWKSFDQLRPTEQLDRSESTLDRVDALIGDDIIKCIVGQTNTLDFRQMMDTQKIILVRLYLDREELTSLLGSIIIGQIMLAALSRWDIAEKKRRQFHIYADEFSYFATPAMGILLTQARKYAIGTTVATQVLMQMSEKIQSTVLQAGTKIVFQVQSEDAERLAGEFDHTPPPGDLIERPVRTPTQDVIKHLLGKGHENPEVNKLFNRYIRPIYEHPANNYTDGMYSYVSAGTYEKWKNEELRYCIFGGLWADTEKPLNHFLVQIMEASVQLGSDDYEISLYDAVIKLSSYLNYDLYFISPENMSNAGRLMTVWVANAIVPELEVIKKELFWQIVQAHHRPDCDILMLKPIAKRAEFWEHIVNDPKKAQEHATRECNEIFYYCAGIGLLAYKLSQSPIMVDSGKYEKVEGPRRTYNDMENAIANDLVSLPRGTAMVKTPQGEWKITTKIGKGLDGDFTRKLNLIRKKTRERYCRPRAEVEREIANRIRPDDPPPTQRKHTL